MIKFFPPDFKTELASNFRIDDWEVPLTGSVVNYLLSFLENGDHSYITIESNISLEVIKTINKNGVLSYERAQDGTTKKDFPRGSCVDARPTLALIYDAFTSLIPQIPRYYNCLGGDIKSGEVLARCIDVDDKIKDVGLKLKNCSGADIKSGDSVPLCAEVDKKINDKALKLINCSGSEIKSGDSIPLCSEAKNIADNAVNNFIFGCLPHQFPILPSTICNPLTLNVATDTEGCLKIYASPRISPQISYSSFGDIYPKNTSLGIDTSINHYNSENLKVDIKNNKVDFNILKNTQLSKHRFHLQCDGQFKLSESLQIGIGLITDQVGVVVYAINNKIELYDYNEYPNNLDVNVTRFGTFNAQKYININAGDVSLDTYLVAHSPNKLPSYWVTVNSGGDSDTNSSIITL